MRRLKFTWEGIESAFEALITKGPAFQFNMSDIARMREEMKSLINNLSEIYLVMKERKKADKKKRRAESELVTNEEEGAGESPGAAVVDGEEYEDVQESEDSAADSVITRKDKQHNVIGVLGVGRERENSKLVAGDSSDLGGGLSPLSAASPSIELFETEVRLARCTDLYLFYLLSNLD